MLLSLVVIFTQSIQLSKIVERLALLHHRYRALGRLEHSCSRFNLSAVTRRLNLKQTSLDLHIEHPVEKYGGAERDRTVDPLLAKQVLSQLSYSPMPNYNARVPTAKLVGLGRFELPTSPLSGVRSNQLSYRPDSTAPAEIPQEVRPDAQAALNRALSKGFEDTV